jgi:hypothetical protein
VPKTEVVSTCERLDLKSRGMAALRGDWPTFVLHQPVSNLDRDSVARSQRENVGARV